MIHPDLLAVKKYLYDPMNLICESIQQELESQEYGAYTFKLNKKRILFRIAKTTPTKIGQFVTLWKRINNGPIMPYDEKDSFDLCVINVSKNENFGQFVFSKEALLKYNIISHHNNGGKRAIRVYPAWDIPNSAQAKKTQEWQLNYFFMYNINSKFDFEKIKKLYF